MAKKNLSWIWIVLFILMVVFLYYASSDSVDRYQKLLATGNNEVGTIFDINNKFLQCEYSINGSSYSYTEAVPYKHLVAGEQYVIKYFPNDPKEIAIDFNNPVLPSSYTFDQVMPDRLNDFGSRIEFSYIVEGVKYTRMRIASDPRLLSAEKCIVKYRRDNPAIGYLMVMPLNSSRFLNQ